MEQKDYYQVLGIEPTVDTTKIKAAYRELAFKYHPDRNTGDSIAAEKMKAVNEAYAVLSNSDKRKEYDAVRQQFGSSAYRHFRKNYSEKDIFSGSDINFIFEEMAKAFGLRGFDDIFKEFYGQGYQTFQFKKPGFGATGFFFSGRTGKSRPAQIQFPFMAHLGKLPRLIFEKISGVELTRNGSDIQDVISLQPRQAEHGGPFAYFLKKKSKKLVVKIPPGIRDGQIIRLSGMGQDGKGGGKPGNLYLKIHIKKPFLKRIQDFVTMVRK